MATRNSSRQAAALAKARQRRRVLDKGRDEQDRRIEAFTAAALVTVAEREDAERALDAASGELGKSLRVLLAENVSPERVAALLEMEVTEVRRLAKVPEVGRAGPA
jgi:hypothetical protein